MQFTDAFLEGSVIWGGIPEGYEHMRNQESEDGLYTFAVQYKKKDVKILGCGRCIVKLASLWSVGKLPRGSVGDFVRRWGGEGWRV